MFEESDDDGHLLQQHRPSCSKCFWSFIKNAPTDKTAITSLKSGELSYKQVRVFLPNWSNEAFTHCRGSTKSTDVRPALSSTHGANRHRWPGWSPRGGSRGRVQGVRPPEMTCGFLIQLVFWKKKNYVVYWC